MLKVEQFNLATFTVYLSIFFLAIKLLISPNLGNAEDEVADDKTLSYVCDFIIFICCIANFRLIHKKFYFIFQLFFVIFLSFSFGTILADGAFFDSVKSLLRLFVPFLFFSVLCSYFYNRKNELISISKYLLILVLILTLIGLALLPPSVNRWEGDNEGLWWPAYFNGIHTTTYIVISAFFVMFSLYKIGSISKGFAFAAFITCFSSVAFGWGVRTTTLAMVVLMLSSYYYGYISHNRYRKISVKVSVAVATILYAFVLFDWDTINAISSGRLSMYEFKYYQLMDNSFLTWIVGNGAGSDIVETDFWWWEAKGAHSDLITFLVEGGLVYFVCFLLLLRKLASLVPIDAGRSIVFSLFVTSVLSNGFFVRPLALYFVLFSLALLYVNSEKLTKVP